MEELIKRYKYLNDNKELVLALCINYEVGNNSCEKQELKPYLCAKVSDEIVDAYEELLFTDKDIEDTVLYKHIEELKNNPMFLETVQDLIKKLEERRVKDIQLNPTFTVWKILTYVRNNNKDNACVLDALDKYYNLDRYIVTGLNWKCGYELLQYDDKEKVYNFPDLTLMFEKKVAEEYAVILHGYRGNEFEEEDNYLVKWGSDDRPKNYYAKTNFMAKLANMPMVSLELKKELYQQMQSSSKVKILK
ncbi:MAG: hypothetical protein VZS44_06490 [Bacilli bacterium]|nr:hypothetical protein [Bacilli bacterium]